MSSWGAAKARRVYAALLRIGAAYVHLRLHFRNRAGESVFPGGPYAYQELTAQGVEAELLDFLERILAGRA